MIDAAEQVRAVSRAEGLAAGGDALAIDSADCAPPPMKRFEVFNPFHVDPAAAIPVPGRSETAWSIESVWQGLKVVDKRTAPEMFTATPHKRPPESERRRSKTYDYTASRFDLAGEVIGLVEARWLIYLPTYTHTLSHRVPSLVDDTLRAARAEGRPVRFYDWDDNFDIDDPRGSFAHSALLASWYGGRYVADYLEPLAARLARSGRACPWIDLPTWTAAARRWAA